MSTPPFRRPRNTGALNALGAVAAALALAGAAVATASVAAAAPPSAKPSFAAMKCWYPLAWTMNVSAAEEALKSVGHTPRREETRGYFKDPKLGVAHTSTTDLVFEVHGWKAMVHFDKADRLTAIGFSLEKATEKLVAAELAAYEAKYGAPTERTDAATIRRWQWRNELTWLTVNAARGDAKNWTIGSTWTPAPPK